MHPFKNRGFTLIELLVVIAILGILASIVMMALDDSRRSGRDAAKKTQIQEILKSLELYYTDNKRYPDDGNAVGLPFTNTTLTNQFIGSGMYLTRVPDNADSYYFCSSTDRRSIMIAVNTEFDGPLGTESEYCSVARGPASDGTGYGCTAWMTTNASDPCTERF